MMNAPTSAFRHQMKQISFAVLLSAALMATLCSCSPNSVAKENADLDQSNGQTNTVMAVNDHELDTQGEENTAPIVDLQTKAAQQMKEANRLRSLLDISEDYRGSFVHGDKPAEFQKYIVLHDTEGDSSASSVIDWWDSNGAGVAAHFIVNKDGSIVQAVPLDKITHHAGYGDTGHNLEFGVVEDGRDDMVGTVPIGSWASDYGMNGSSIGIEIVHVGGSGDYPEAQLEALDGLIAYIDAYYGFESQITDHKAWRTGNSDTSPEFAEYLDSYQTNRTHV